MSSVNGRRRNTKVVRIVEFWSRVQTADNGQRGGGETHSMAFHSGLIASLVHTPIKLCFFSLLKEQFETAACQSPDCFLIRMNQEQLVLRCQQTTCIKRKTICVKRMKRGGAAVVDEWGTDGPQIVKLRSTFGTRGLNFVAILVRAGLTLQQFWCTCTPPKFCSRSVVL